MMRLLSVAGALVVALAVVGAAEVVLRLSRADERRSLAFRFAVGLPIFGSVCFLVGLWSTSVLAQSAVVGVFVTFGAIGVARWTRETGETRPTEVGHRTRWQASRFVDFVLLGVTVLAGVVVAMLPPFTLDELAYHLAVPKAWVADGVVSELPLISHSYFPFGVESASLPLLTGLGSPGGSASHFLHLFAAIAAMALLRDELERRGHSLAAAAAFFSTPALAVTAGWSWVEWPLIAICIATLIELMREEPDGPFLAMAIAAGLLTKYTFLPFLALTALPFLLRRESHLWMARQLFFGAIGGSLFFIRNQLLTNNPFYPFLETDAPSVGGYRDAGGLLATFETFVFDRRFVDESLGIGVFLIAAVAVAFVRRVSSMPLRIAVVLNALFGVGLLLVAAPSSRIVLPFFVVPLFVASAVIESLAPVARSAISIALRVAAVAQLAIVILYVATFEPFALLSGKESDEAFLSRHRRFYTELSWLNEQLPAEAKTLVVGAQELYWLHGRVRGGGNFDGARVAAYVSWPDLTERLKRERFTHVAILGSGLRVGEPSEDVKLRERETVLSPEVASRLRGTLLADATVVGRRGMTMLFELR